MGINQQSCSETVQPALMQLLPLHEKAATLAMISMA